MSKNQTNSNYPYPNSHHGPYQVTGRGVNDQGNKYTTRSFEYKPNAPSYRYSNQDGSYYYRNPDNSRYYDNGRGQAKYTSPQGREVHYDKPGQYQEYAKHDEVDQRSGSLGPSSKINTASTYPESMNQISGGEQTHGGTQQSYKENDMEAACRGLEGLTVSSSRGIASPVDDASNRHTRVTTRLIGHVRGQAVYQSGYYDDPARSEYADTAGGTTTAYEGSNGDGYHDQCVQDQEDHGCADDGYDVGNDESCGNDYDCGGYNYDGGGYSYNDGGYDYDDGGYDYSDGGFDYDDGGYDYDDGYY